MHVFAYWTVATYANAGLGSDTAALVGITGTLDELRGQAGKTATSLEDTFLALVAEEAEAA